MVLIVKIVWIDNGTECRRELRAQSRWELKAQGSKLKVESSKLKVN
jgi:hypothetical protein